ncbi:MAG: c-type cytochrome [Chloroflexota bacterium]
MSVVLTGILLFFSITACTGLGGEPEIIRTLPPTTAVPELGYLDVSPYISRGAGVYAVNCTSCHGPEGAGNGELAQNGSIPDPGNFTDPLHTQTNTPLDYFSTITNGNLENLMPPWEAALSEADRWAATMYVYTRHYTDEQLTRGERLVNQQADFIAFTDTRAMMQLSDADLYELIETQQQSIIPEWETLSETDRQAVVAYVRTLSIREPATALGLSTADAVGMQQATPPPGPGNPPQAAVEAEQTGTVIGTVRNGTSASDVPEGLVVTLHIIDAEFNETLIDTTITPDTSYQFSDVPFAEDFIYFVSTRYAERNYASAPVTPDMATLTIELPLVIYEVTNDSSVIEINSMLTQITPRGSMLEVAEFVRYANLSDEVYISEETGVDGRSISMTFHLPPGAVVVGLENEQRFVVSQDEFTVQDTSAVIPGEDNIFVVSYLLPYSSGAIIEYPVEYAFDGQLRLLIDSETVRAEADWLTFLGEETLNDFAYQTYGGALSLNSGDLIRYELTGRAPGAGSSADTGVVTEDNLLPVALIIGAVLIFAIVAAIFFANRRTGSAPMSKNRLIDGLLRQIAELDTQHDAGDINHDLYHHRRQQLKTRLSELMGDDTASDEDSTA